MTEDTLLSREFTAAAAWVRAQPNYRRQDEIFTESRMGRWQFEKHVLGDSVPGWVTVEPLELLQRLSFVTACHSKDWPGLLGDADPTDLRVTKRMGTDFLSPRYTNLDPELLFELTEMEVAAELGRELYKKGYLRREVFFRHDRSINFECELHLCYSLMRPNRANPNGRTIELGNAFFDENGDARLPYTKLKAPRIQSGEYFK